MASRHAASSRPFAIDNIPGPLHISRDLAAFIEKRIRAVKGMRERNGSKGRYWVAGMIIFALALPLFAEPANAQQVGERRTLLELLFGTPKRTTPPPTVPTRKKPKVTKTVKKAPQGATSASSKAAAPPPVAKLENARKILVVGDFIANGLSEGLEEAFAASPGVVVVGRGNGSSGLVREDYYNWPAELPAILDEVRPELVVVEIGANDRQQITTSAGKEDFRTENWIKEYETRIATFAKLITSRGLPLLWVGVPPFRPQNMTSDVLMLNGIYQKAAAQHGGEFIDIWDGFVDSDGRFVVTGSDINGQQVRLRSTDGINLTAAGKRKLAFYVEKSARRHLGEMASPDLLQLDAGTLPALNSLPPSQIQNIVSTPPINLSDPDLDGATQLLGDRPLPAAAIPSPRDMLVGNGRLPSPPPGRVDDFRILHTGSTKK